MSIRRPPIPQPEAEDHQENAKDQGVSRKGPDNRQASRCGLQEEQNAQTDRDQAAQPQHPLIDDFIS